MIMVSPVKRPTPDLRAWRILIIRLFVRVLLLFWCQLCRPMPMNCKLVSLLDGTSLLIFLFSILLPEYIVTCAWPMEMLFYVSLISVMHFHRSLYSGFFRSWVPASSYGIQDLNCLFISWSGMLHSPCWKQNLYVSGEIWHPPRLPSCSLVVCACCRTLCCDVSEGDCHSKVGDGSILCGRRRCHVKILAWPSTIIWYLFESQQMCQS